MAVQVESRQAPQKGAPGRPPAITPEIEQDLMLAIERGLTITDACMVAGISRATFHRHASMFPDFRDRAYRARRRKVLALAEMAEQAIQVAIACGDWRAPLAALKLALQRLDRERVTDEPTDDADADLDPSKVAAVIRAVRELDRGDRGAEGDSAAAEGGTQPLPAGRADTPAGGLPGHRPD